MLPYRLGCQPVKGNSGMKIKVCTGSHGVCVDRYVIGDATVERLPRRGPVFRVYIWEEKIGYTPAEIVLTLTEIDKIHEAAHSLMVNESEA